MNQTLLKIIASREDLSDFVFHFTKGRNAKETLKIITSEQKLKDIKGKGFICFTEAPLLSLIKMFEFFDRYESPMYSPYGIAIKKDNLFEIGGRPVIYGLPEEKEYLNDIIKWRFEHYQPNANDFTWLREWRLPQSEISIDIDNSFVIVKQKIELEEFMFKNDEVVDIEFDGCIADGQFWGSATGITKRSFKGISIEDLREFNNLSKSEIDKKISKQSSQDKNEIGLGGVVQ